jgi:hypothetical protein
MWARQCVGCGVIDAREAFDTDDEAAAGDDSWHCEECGAREFEVVVMPETGDDPVELTDEYE